MCVPRMRSGPGPPSANTINIRKHVYRKKLLCFTHENEICTLTKRTIFAQIATMSPAGLYPDFMAAFFSIFLMAWEFDHH